MKIHRQSWCAVCAAVWSWCTSQSLNPNSPWNFTSRRLSSVGVKYKIWKTTEAEWTTTQRILTSVLLTTEVFQIIVERCCILLFHWIPPCETEDVRSWHLQAVSRFFGPTSSTSTSQILALPSGFFDSWCLRKILLFHTQNMTNARSEEWHSAYWSLPVECASSSMLQPTEDHHRGLHTAMQWPPASWKWPCGWKSQYDLTPSGYWWSQADELRNLHYVTEARGTWRVVLHHRHSCAPGRSGLRRCLQEDVYIVIVDHP